jgi:hypothetical protein
MINSLHNFVIIVRTLFSSPVLGLVEEKNIDGRDLQNLKIKIHRTIILPVVLYGCETWSLTILTSNWETVINTTKVYYYS